MKSKKEFSYIIPSWVKNGQGSGLEQVGGAGGCLLLDADIPFESVLFNETMFDDEPEDLIRYCQNYGFKVVVFLFSTGFGIDLEKKVWRKQKKFFEAARRADLYPFIYMKGRSISTSILDRNVGGNPEFAKNIVINGKGEKLHYGSTPDRYIVCVNKNDFYMKHYMLDRAKRAIDIGAYGIFFDNFEAGRSYCYCENCQRDFKNRLEENIGSRELRIKYGISDIKNWNILADSRINQAPAYGEKVDWQNRLWQEWVEFQCDNVADTLNSFCEEIIQYARQRYRREIAISFNSGPFLAYPHANTNLAINHSKIKYALPFFEWGGELNVGRIKLASVNNPIIAYDHPELFSIIPGKRTSSIREGSLDLSPKDWLMVASGNLLWGKDNFFARIYQDYFAGTQPVNPIAILYHWKSMEWAERLDDYLEVSESVSNICPFDTVVELNDKSLASHPLLILPWAECLEKGEADIIRGYVKQGGTILSLGQTSLQNSNKKGGKGYLLADLFGVTYAEVMNNYQRKEYRNEYGKGKVIHLPFFQNPSLLNKYLSSFSFLPCHVSSKKGKVNSFLYRKENKLLLHLVGEAAGIEIELCVPEDWVPHCSFLSPYLVEQGRISLPYKVVGRQNSEKKIAIFLPDTNTYSLIIIENGLPVPQVNIINSTRILEDGQTYSLTVQVQNPRPEKISLEMIASIYSPLKNYSSDWRIIEEKQKVVLAPGEKKNVDLHVFPPSGKKSFFITQTTRLLLDLKEKGRIVNRAVATFEKPVFTDKVKVSSGWGIRIFKEDNSLGVAKALSPGLSQHEIAYRESQGSNLFCHQYKYAEKPVLSSGAICDLYFSGKANLAFKPPIGVRLYSDRNYDQRIPGGVLESTLRVTEESCSRVEVAATFKMPPFQVTEKIVTNYHDGRYYISYLFEAYQDGQILDWALEIPAAPELTLRRIREDCFSPISGPPDMVFAGGKAFPKSNVQISSFKEFPYLVFVYNKLEKSLVVEFYHPGQFDLLLTNPYRNDNLLIFPLNGGKLKKIRRGEKYRLDFALSAVSPDPLIKEEFGYRYLPDSYLKTASASSIVFPLEGKAVVSGIDYRRADNILLFRGYLLDQRVTFRIIGHWPNPKVWVAGKILSAANIKKEPCLIELKVKAKNSPVDIRVRD